MKRKIILIGVGTIIALLCLAGCTSSPQKESDSNTNSNPPPQQTDTEIFISVFNLSTTAKFYSFESEGVTIRYFAVKDASGNVHIAFDACDVCYEAKKGYRQNGDLMHCINCGKEFPITSIGTDNTAGGCWPSYLPMRVDENSVVIKIADLVAKQYLFS
jgi:uncharacterized membrane protein